MPRHVIAGIHESRAAGKSPLSLLGQAVLFSGLGSSDSSQHGRLFASAHSGAAGLQVLAKLRTKLLTMAQDEVSADVLAGSIKSAGMMLSVCCELE